MVSDLPATAAPSPHLGHLPQPPFLPMMTPKSPPGYLLSQAISQNPKFSLGQAPVRPHRGSCPPCLTHSPLHKRDPSLPWARLPVTPDSLALSHRGNPDALTSMGQTLTGLRCVSHHEDHCGGPHSLLVPTCATSNIPVPPAPGWSGVFLSMLSFLFFTDMGIYWIHRGLHHKLFYKVWDRMGGSGQESLSHSGGLCPSCSSQGMHARVGMAEQGLTV